MQYRKIDQIILDTLPAMQKPNRHIKQIRLTKRETIRLTELMLNPPPRNERFTSAQARYLEMKSRVGSEHVTQAGGNVFLDLGFSAEVAAQIKAESEATIHNNSSE